MIYLDHASSTPLAPAALEAMLPFLSHEFGNPSGLHGAARRARRALDDARDEMAAACGCEAGEVVFTSGGTEADNLAVLGAVRGARRDGHDGAVPLAAAIEHKAVLAPCSLAGGSLVAVTAEGRVSGETVAEAIERARAEHGGAPTPIAVVSVMLANNETGVVQPVEEIAATVRELAPEALLHTDAVHAFPWLDVATLARSCDLVSLSAHKFNGPKGAGVLVVRGGARRRLESLVHGGGQEADIRPGTQNVAAVAGMAAAARVAVAERAATVERVGVLRDRLADGLLAACPNAAELAPRPLRVAGNCHLAFSGVSSEELCLALDAAGLAASAGSSCSSGATEPSHVLQAMGVERALARGALRLTLGSTTTAGEVQRALEIVPGAVSRCTEGERASR